MCLSSTKGIGHHAMDNILDVSCGSRQNEVHGSIDTAFQMRLRE